MTIKNAHLFYFSPTYTTKKVIQSIGEGLGVNIIEHDLTFACDSTEEFHLEKDEIAIVGVPVYAGRTPVITRGILNRIHGDNSLAVAVVVYGNRAFDDAMLELKDILQGNGFSVMAGGAFIGEHSYTRKVATRRPDSDDLAKAVEFGKLIAEKINTDTFTTDIAVPGNTPYKADMPKREFAPTINNECIYCRKCWSVCPVRAIDRNKPDVVQVDKCIKCYACVKICGYNGREIPGNPLKDIINFLETTCAERKEPEIFI